MEKIYLCKKHLTGMYNQIETDNKEKDCKFCIEEKEKENECCCKRSGLWIKENEHLYIHSKNYCRLIIKK